MPIRSLLVPLLETPDDRETLLHALKFARDVNAHVTVLFCGGHLSELVSAEPPEYARVKPALQIEARALLGRQAEDARQGFESLAREAGVVVSEASDSHTAHFEVARGAVVDAVPEAASVHDLVVFSRSKTYPGTRSLRLDAIKATLQSSGRPVLVLAEKPGKLIGGTIAIAWNGSIEGAHAVSAALPLLLAAGSVHILTVATEKTSTEQANRLQKYLGWHGIQATIHTSRPTAESAAATLAGMAQSVSADLLVLGAYTHNRIRQTILGGVTHHMVERTDLSLLLSR